MTKRILLFSAATLFVLFGSVLGAEQKSDADNKSTETNVWTQILESAPAGIKAEVRLEKHATSPQNTVTGTAPSSGSFTWGAKPSGPLDFCPITAACFDGLLANPCAVPGFPGGELCEYQDPAVLCTPSPGCPTYPFEVRSVHILLSNCDPVNACVVLVTPGIREAIYPTPGCPVPGNIICTGPSVQISIPPNTFCQEFVIPLDANCCVDTTYFACLNFQFQFGQCNLAPCLDQTCNPCCSYWDQNAGSFRDMCPGFPGNFAIWTDGFASCQNDCPKPPTGQNHYKTWRTSFLPVGVPTPLVKDQFITEPLQLQGIDYLSNPVVKVVDGNPFPIVDPDDHLLWYRTTGSDRNLRVDYENQFEVTSVTIRQPVYFLVPAQKLPHPPYTNLDHYKAYVIQNPQTFSRPVQLQDQFDATPEQITTLTPLFFLTPAQKNAEPTYDLVTHYVAYRISPPRNAPQIRTVIDQFGQRQVNIQFSELLLVPTIKRGFGQPECSDGIDNDGDGLIDFPADCGCTDALDLTEAPDPVTECSDGVDNDGDGLVDYPADCGCTNACDATEAPNPTTPQCNDGVDNDGDGLIDWPADPGCANECDNDEVNAPPTPRPNHYKTWRTFDFGPPVFRTVTVRDQFMVDNLVRVDSIHFLSNPTTKNAEPIIDPDDHLTWYRARGRDTLLMVRYRNQFTPRDSFQIDSVRYLLLPTTKLPHPPFDNLDHYKAYRIRNPQPLMRSVFMQDQFLGEGVNILTPRYFLTPAQKNASPRYDSVTHYVAYEFFPHRFLFQQRQTEDQFGLHNIRADSSMLLLVPTEKLCRNAKGDMNGVGGLTPADVVLMLNCVYLRSGDCELCFADVNCSGDLTPTEVVLELNAVYLLRPFPCQ